MFEAATHREINVKSSSLKRRMTPGLVMLLHFMNSEEIIIIIKKASGIPKENSLLQIAGTSLVCVQRSAKE